MSDAKFKHRSRSEAAGHSSEATRFFLWTAAIVTALAMSLGACSGDGCSCSSCIGDANVEPVSDAGTVQIVVTNLPAPSGSTIFLPAEFEGSSGANTFDGSRTIEITGPGQTETFPDRTAEPGTWSVTVRTDPIGSEGIAAWSANCNGMVITGNTTTFTFRHGEAGCMTAP